MANPKPEKSFVQKMNFTSGGGSSSLISLAGSGAGGSGLASSRLMSLLASRSSGSGVGSSSSLAQAYGVALTGTMLVTTILAFFVIASRAADLQDGEW